MTQRGRHLAPKLRRISRTWALPLSLAMLLVWSSVAWADNVQNDVVVGGNDTFTAGASTTVNYRIAANSGDGQAGCNAADSSNAVVTVNTPSGVSATPSSVTFNSCGTDKSVVFSSTTVGSHEITVSVADSGTGTYNVNPAKFTLNVLAAPPPSDTTPPVITPVVSGTLGTNGWYRSDVNVTWNVVDDESAISSTSGCDETNITADTTETTLTCTATSAGGTSSESVTIKRDATAPVVSVTGVTNGATYILGSVPTAACDTSDATSDVATHATLSTSGGPLGSVTATCSGAVDNAGNSGSASVTYNVVYDWTGFFRPVDNLPTLNQAKAGSAIPVKFSLQGNQGLSIFASGFPQSAPIACDATAPVDGIETVTAGNSNLSYDETADQYTYVWKTDKSWTGCRQLTVKLIDGTIHTANFKLTK
jgi:hypothetical protein